MCATGEPKMESRDGLSHRMGSADVTRKLLPLQRTDVHR